METKRLGLTSALLAAATLTVIPPPRSAKADIAVEWTFESLQWNSLPGAPPSTAANILTGLFPEYNPGHISAAASLIHFPTTGTAVVTGRPGNGSNLSLSSNHWNMNDYYEFDIAPNTYSSLSFSMTGGVGSPGYFEIFYSSNNNGLWNVLGAAFPKGSPWNATTADATSTYWIDLSQKKGLTGIRFVDATNGNVTSPLYPYPGENTIDDVTFSIAPEPASATAIAPAAFILARRRRKRA